MPPSTAVSRRAAVGGMAAATATVVGGCTISGVDRAAKTGRTPATSRRPGTAPDVTLAATVLAQERAMLVRIRATVRAHPTLRAPLARARAAHQAHVRLLAGAVPDSASPTAKPAPARPTVPARAGPALAAVARAEDRLSLVGRRNAVAAESGAFARVLASMAAAATQQGCRLSAAGKNRP